MVELMGCSVVPAPLLPTLRGLGRRGVWHRTQGALSTQHAWSLLQGPQRTTVAGRDVHRT